MRPPRPDRWTALLAAIGVLAAALALLRGTVYGVGVASDSVEYLSVARSLAAGDGLVAWNGAVFRDAAPLFPVTLGAIAVAGPDPADAAAWLNAAAFGLTAFAAGAWVRSRALSPLLAAWAACAVAFSPALGSLAATAMTEPLFVLWTALALFALDRRLEGGPRRLLFAAAACAALACLARYVGAALVAAGIALLLAHRGIPPRERARDAATFAAVALAPLGAWMLRNLIVAGSPTGRLFSTGFALPDGLHTAASELARMALGEGGFALFGAAAETLLGLDPGGRPSWGGALASLAALAALAAGAARLLAALRRRGCAPPPAAFAAPTAFAAAYALVFAVALPRNDAQLFPRYAAPLFVPGLAAAVLLLGGLLRLAAERGRPLRLTAFGRPAHANAAAIAIAAALALWLAQQAAATAADVRERQAEGWGFASRTWAESETVDWLRSHPIEGPLHGVNAYALYAVADIRSKHDLFVEPPPISTDRTLRWIGEAHAAGGDIWFVWFHERAMRRHDYAWGVETLLALPGVQPWAVLEDGLVMRAPLDPAAAPARPVEALLESSRPLVGGRFDLYLHADGERLIYVREGCSADDAAPRFFLHAVPADEADLPPERRASGFANLDFSFAEAGFRHDGRCVAVRRLPDWAAAVRTGQWVPARGERLWSVEASLGENGGG